MQRKMMAKSDLNGSSVLPLMHCLGVPLTYQLQKRHRAKQPVAYGQLLERAITQRMFVLDRKPTGTADQPEQVIDLAGSTGNVYQVVIGKVPTCTCPYARKGHSECKHIVYVRTFY